ncbi:Na+/H+ antiporter NhaC family protein [Muribaculaceae bacterium Isolate-104 (HZI)]|nr:Na+/H+ antiporter NhaC family protein [Muribaculaceae bacterium Isolate-104 (HZI)]
MDTSASQHKTVSVGKGLLSLSPVVLFLLLYLAVSAVIGDFYKIPIAVALAAACIWSIAVFRGRSLTERIEVFSRSAGHSDILYMVWIFILAGAFASLAREIGAVEATVSMTLHIFPAEFIVPGLFLAACFISLSIGTSVGTVVALSPLAAEIAAESGGNTPFIVAAVLGGAFFGDNLSFISDTTIAATRTQGCNTGDKFRANLWLAVPAACVTLAAYMAIPSGIGEVSAEATDRPWLVLPYLIIIAMAVCSINVTVVLCCGIAATLLLGLTGGTSATDMLGFMGGGIDSMGNLIIITLLAAGMLGVVKATGGISFLLQALTRHTSGKRGAQTCIAVLVAAVNVCTANNTVAIITSGSISRDIAERFGLDPRKTASLLDTCSCITQCLIPYGAQTLLATSLAGITPAEPWRYLIYPWALAVCVTLSIIFGFPRKLNSSGVNK